MLDYFTTESLGKKRHITPDGFMICKDVPIGRTGIQQYSSDQVVEVPPGPGGIVDMERLAVDVFSDTCMTSFEGKPVTNDHPPGGGVTSTNWRDYAVGHIQNVRRGASPQDDLLFADLFINDPQTIDDINGGKREVSCGYDHDVIVIDRGRGRQVNIVGNHLAIVDQGRCGPRCAIGDVSAKPVPRKGKAMAKISDLLTRAFTAKTKDELEKLHAEAQDSSDVGEQHIHVHMPDSSRTRDDDDDKDKDDKKDDKKSEDQALRTVVKDGFDKIAAAFQGLDARIAKLESRDSADETGDGETSDEENCPPEEKKEKKEDEFPGPNAGENHSLGALGFENPLWKSDSKDGKRKARAKDSVHLEDAFQEVLARAEILVPGIRLPAFDGRLAPQQTIDRVCSFRRRVVADALKDEVTKDLLESLNGNRSLDLKTMSCERVATIFDAAATIRQREVSDYQMGSGKRQQSGGPKIQTIADLNDANAKFWESRNGRRA